MVLRRDDVADIVQQRHHHALLVGAVAQRSARRLQRMLVAVDRIADGVAGQLPEHGQHGIRQGVDMLQIAAVDDVEILDRRIVHPGELGVVHGARLLWLRRILAASAGGV
jgi:hypothetical protein